MSASRKVIEALAVTAELTGTQLSPAAARVMAEDLAAYPEEQVLKALVRCRKELRGRMSIADVIARLDDGRPGPEEAWAMVPHDEAASAFLTDEMREAFRVCYPLLCDGDNVQARMSFIETYRAKVQQARDEGAPVSWSFTPGTDRYGRESAVREALEKGRISSQGALALLPAPAEDDEQMLSLLGASLKRIGQTPAKDAEQNAERLPAA